MSPLQTRASSLATCQKALEVNRSSLPTSPRHNPVNYGLLYKDGKTVLEIDNPCLGKLDYSEHGYPKKDRIRQDGKEAFFIFHQAGDTEKTRAYLDYLIGPKSPWRKLIARQEPQDIEFVLKYGYVLTDLQFPANFIVNFLTAFRMSYEKPYCLNLWVDLQAEGASRESAAVMTSMCMGYTTDNPISYLDDTGHSAYSLRKSGALLGADLDIVNRLKAGSPEEVHFSKWNFEQNTVYSPCNVIWNTGKKVSNDNLFLDTCYQFLSDLKTGSHGRQLFPNPSARTSRTYMMKDWAEWCRYIDSLDSQQRKAA